MRLIFGLNDHTAETVQKMMQQFRAAIRLLRPDIDIEIIRTDGAPENPSKGGRASRVICGLVPAESSAHDAPQRGRAGRTAGRGPAAVAKHDG